MYVIYMVMMKRFQVSKSIKAGIRFAIATPTLTAFVFR